MARYSATSGLSSYSSYRSPYSDSNTSSFTSSYTLPTYESKFESLITRGDGTSRSRAGTSTKFDYLNSYTSKYDFPSSYSSSASSSKYDTASNGYTRSSSGYGSTSRYGALSSSGTSSSTGYGGTSLSGLNADDLTRSYFAKYYNKAAPDEHGSETRASRALSVYLDESNNSYNTNNSNSYNSSYSSSAAATEPKRTVRSSSVLDDPRRGRRFSRLLSEDDVDSFSSTLTRRHSIAPSRASKYSEREEEPTTTGSTSSTTSKYFDRKRNKDTRGEDALATTRSRFLDRSKDEDSTPSYSRFSVARDKEEETNSQPVNGYSRRLSSYLDDSSSSPSYKRDYSTRDNKDDESGSSTSTLTRRLSMYKDDELSSPSYRRDYTTRAYGGRTESCDLEERSTATNRSTQDGGEVAGGTGGLKNLGNTCFMNSVIQCLSNTSLLVDYLLTDEYSKDINTTNSSMKGSLIKAFATLIKGIWKPGGRTLDPSSLKGAVQRFAPRFSGYNQEDSQEFLRYLLEGLHEDVNRVTSKPQPINTEIDSNLSVAEQSMEAWKRYLRRDDSKLVDIFVGQLKSTLRCSTCDFESVTFEPFWDLSLPIPARTGEVSLKDCLEAFTKEEIMDGDEMPTCERCKTRRRCSKFYTLYKLPKILVIHLKRFSPTERFRSKLGTTVTFPLTALDVAKFSDNPARSTYSCYAVSNHSGTLYSGHYTAYAKNPKSSEWHFFNDSRVSKSSSSNVISNEAYLLFFQLL